MEVKAFPGTLRVMRNFTEDMKNPQSAAFQQIASEIVTALNGAYRNIAGYINSTVLELRAGSVVATVSSVFEPNSPATQNITMQALSDAINKSSNGILSGSTFTASTLCNSNPPPCDATTTDCVDTGNGSPLCDCKSGYISTGFETRSCSACPSGQKSVNNVCVDCPFGYSGFNCNDSSLLALVVVACVLGGLMLIMIVAIIIYNIVSSKKPKQVPYTHSPYSPDEYRTWPAERIAPIPRATVSNSADSGTGNAMEMNEPGNRKSHSNGMTGSYDLMPLENNTFKGKTPSRYSYLVQGHENPYFIPGDEQRTT